MALAFVRQIGTPGNGVNGTTAAINHSVTAGASGAQVGDLISVVTLCLGGNAAASVTDARGNTYTKQVQEDQTGASGQQGTIAIHTTIVSTALLNGDTIVVSWGGTQNGYIGAWEFSGVNNPPRDANVNSAAVGTSGNATTTGQTSFGTNKGNLLGNTNANALLLAASMLQTPTTNNPTPSGTWTSLGGGAMRLDASNSLVASYQIISTTTSVDYNVPFTGGIGWNQVGLVTDATIPSLRPSAPQVTLRAVARTSGY